MTLDEFLLARISDDEGCARAILNANDDGERYSAEWSCPWSGAVDVGDADDINAANDSRVAEHIARHDPARVLAECAAKRAIVALHRGGHECSTYDKNGEVDNCTWVPDGDNCSTLRLLAQSHADHPDYDGARRS